MAQDTDEQALVRATLADLQPLLIDHNVAYCGIVGFDTNGHWPISPIFRGEERSCLVEDNGVVVVATTSFHTHGAYARDHVNEVPSIADVEGHDYDKLVEVLE